MSEHPNQRPSHLHYPIAFSKTIDVSPTRAWETISDTYTWNLWGPSITAVDTRERFIKLGATGRIRTILGVWLPFRITSFKPQKYWDWQVGGMSATGHHIEPLAPERCRLSFTVPIWAAPYGIICHVALNRIDRLLVSTSQGV